MLRERPERGRGTGCVHRQCVTRETLSSAPARVPASAPSAAPAPTCEGSTEPSTPSDWNVLSRENILNTHASQVCQLGTLLMRSCVRLAPADARVSSAASPQPRPYPIKPLFFFRTERFRGRTKSFRGQGVLFCFLKASVWASTRQSGDHKRPHDSSCGQRSWRDSTRTCRYAPPHAHYAASAAPADPAAPASSAPQT